MTEAGILLGMSSLFGLIGSTIGGALTDKFGRKKLILFGLVFSALSTLTLAWSPTSTCLYPLAGPRRPAFQLAGPAHDAMIADILPEEAEPGGLWHPARGRQPRLDHRSDHRRFGGEHRLLLPVRDRCGDQLRRRCDDFPPASPKPNPGNEAHTRNESFFKPCSGIAWCCKDFAFMAFIVAGILMLLVYQQMYSSLSVYLRDNHGIDPRAMAS